MYLCIDTENNGLHGQAFAFGYVLTANDGKRVKEGIYVAPWQSANPYSVYSEENEATTAWLQENVLPNLPAADCATLTQLYRKFVAIWELSLEIAKSHNEPLCLVADVPFPCETGFVKACMDYKAFAVYPLIDVASVLLAKGYDPTGNYARLPDELPKHSPLNDARQSSRILHALLSGEAVESEAAR